MDLKLTAASAAEKSTEATQKACPTFSSPADNPKFLAVVAMTLFDSFSGMLLFNLADASGRQRQGETPERLREAQRGVLSC